MTYGDVEPELETSSPDAVCSANDHRRVNIPLDDTNIEETVRPMSGEADQWSKIISRERIPAPDGRRVTYLGESWTLSYMIQWKSRGSVSEKDDMMNNRPPPSEVDDDSGGLHVPVPMEQDTPSPRSAIASSMVRDQLPPDIQLALIEAYFAYNHILYPVVSEDEFRTGFANRTLSPLLLAAVLYAGALHVSDPVIYRAGFDSRQTCLRKLYNRSKKIFFDEEDNGETGDQLSRVQAAFLLHNMWSSPNATMDPWTWLGLATRLAQNMGMHRSTARSSLKESDRRLWKRIWWSLYVSCLNLVGRLVRTANDELPSLATCRSRALWASLP
jgi:hypothetical protein